jgi:hypothetical protein
MKIACDVNVSNRSIKFLKQAGFEIVYKAGAGQPDKKWFAAALERGADVFISGDLDIAFLVEKQYDKRIKWLNFPNMPYNEGHANKWLLERLKQIEEVWGL